VVTRASELPAYRQIARAIRDEIRSGRYRPGDYDAHTVGAAERAGYTHPVTVASRLRRLGVDRNGKT
jgi:DNA-binding transcriptional regulator YhcF (GntR family)